MTAHKPDRWIGEAVTVGDLDRVKANMAAAGERINDARRHIRSARLLASDDVTLAIAACHDAIRKAITGHMAASGVRPRGGEGAHRIVLEYARAVLGDVLDPDDLIDADEIRRDRALAEYGDFAARQLKPTDVIDAAGVAERIVNAVAVDLAGSG